MSKELQEFLKLWMQYRHGIGPYHPTFEGFMEWIERIYWANTKQEK